jgi:hypothetical protein
MYPLVRRLLPNRPMGQGRAHAAKTTLPLAEMLKRKLHCRFHLDSAICLENIAILGGNSGCAAVTRSTSQRNCEGASEGKTMLNARETDTCLRWKCRHGNHGNFSSSLMEMYIRATRQLPRIPHGKLTNGATAISLHSSRKFPCSSHGNLHVLSTENFRPCSRKYASYLGACSSPLNAGNFITTTVQ